MKYFYIAVTVAENNRYCAFVIRASKSDNLLSKLAINGILHANIYPTKKRAAEVVDRWNAAYKTNGEYLFDA